MGKLGLWKWRGFMRDAVWIGAIHAETTDHLPVEIVETESFYKDALAVLSEEDLVDLKMRIATNPKSGVLVPHTDGLRKLRYAAKGKGKRGGARIVYYYQSHIMPIFLLAFFSKGEKDDLTPMETARIRDFVKQLVVANMKKRLRVVKR